MFEVHKPSKTGWGFCFFSRLLFFGGVFRFSYDGRFTFGQDGPTAPWFGYKKDTNRSYIFYRFWMPFICISLTFGEPT